MLHGFFAKLGAIYHSTLRILPKGITMRKKTVYDWPTRLFHWFVAAFFLAAFAIVKLVNDDEPTYVFHMLFGLTLSFTVMLRIAWGFFGSKHARFTDFALNPRQLFDYFKGFLTSSKKKWAGHNPASSWAALVMYFLALGLGITGYLMTTTTNKEDFEDIHEIFADAFIIVVILHVVGIFLHTVRHKELIGLSMIDGKKNDVTDTDAIQETHGIKGILLLAIILAFGFNLYKNYDAESKSLNLFGKHLQLQSE
jgi:cytochrome b